MNHFLSVLPCLRVTGLPALCVTLCATLCVALTMGGCAASGTGAVSCGDVLLGDAPFSFTDAGGTEALTIADVPGLFSPESPYARIWRFALVDLDDDDKMEAVLQIIDTAGDMGGFLILHEEDGAVYGCKSDYRTFEELKLDGSFGYSSPAGTEWGVCTLRFTDGGADRVPLFCGVTEDSWASVSYTVENRPATEAEYEAAQERQRQKPDAVWYDFTDTGVHSILEQREDS